ncbi:helix-turn-helix domain-containing protein [Kitasatospora sp. NPDC094028]
MIVLAPHPCPQDDVTPALTAVVQESPQRYLGGSGTHQLADTEQARADASRALTVAQRVPARVHMYTTTVPLAHILDARADAWALTYMAPLLNLPEDRRERLLTTLRLGLDLTPAAVGRSLGTHRNTVARRLSEAAGLVGADLQDIVQRAVLSLALELELRTRAGRTAEPTSIGRILQTDDVRRWVEHFLEPLRADRRPLLRTLTAWSAANANVEAAAEALGLNPATVRAHLRRAEELLQRRLVTGALPHDMDAASDAGAHDVILALAVVRGVVDQI